MNKQQLIQSILTFADSEGNGVKANYVVEPLRQFGKVMFINGRWWFFEQHAEINTYTSTKIATQEFEEGQFEVTHND